MNFGINHLLCHFLSVGLDEFLVPEFHHGLECQSVSPGQVLDWVEGCEGGVGEGGLVGHVVRGLHHRLGVHHLLKERQPRVKKLAGLFEAIYRYAHLQTQRCLKIL